MGLYAVNVKKCPNYEGKTGLCKEDLPTVVLDLITRLQAENEKNENIIRLADKTIETANAEIERLQNILICFMDALGKVRKVDDIDEISLIPLMSELNKQYRSELKAEAYKEFAERLKAVYEGFDDKNEVILYPNLLTAIDCLLIGMVGDSNAE